MREKCVEAIKMQILFLPFPFPIGRGNGNIGTTTKIMEINTQLFFCHVIPCVIFHFFSEMVSHYIDLKNTQVSLALLNSIHFG